MNENSESYALQICHSYKPPFGNIAALYSEFFRDSKYRLVTVFLTGEASDQINSEVFGEVIFLGHESSALSGLKLRVLRDLLRIYRDRRFHFIIAHRYKPIYIACLLTALAYRVRVYGVVHSAKTFKRFFRKLFASCFKRRLTILAVSDSLANEVRKALAQYPQAGIRHFYNRINTRLSDGVLLSRDQARENLQLDSNSFVFANVARLHAKKNQHCLITAFAAVADKMPQAMLLLVGDGDLKGELQDLASELGVGDKVIFAGFVPQAERYYRAFDVFVLSSKIETFGLVLLESMVAGVPVIASNAGGVPEVVGDVGRLFESGNAQALASAMLEEYESHKDAAVAAIEAAKLRAWVEQEFSLDAGRRDFWQMWDADCRLQPPA